MSASLVRPRRLTVRLAVVLALVGGSTVSSSFTSAAQAAELRFTDARHDVVSFDVAADLDPEEVDDIDDLFPPAPGRHNGDIKSVFIHYRANRLVVRTNFVRLSRTPNTLLDYVGVIRTDEHRKWLFNVVTSPDHYEGHDELYTWRGRKACEIGHMFDYRHDFARVSIKLSCLGDPRYVQLLLGASTVRFKPGALRRGELRPGDVMLYFDDATSEDLDFTAWTPNVRVG